MDWVAWKMAKGPKCDQPNLSHESQKKKFARDSPVTERVGGAGLESGRWVGLETGTWGWDCWEVCGDAVARCALDNGAMGWLGWRQEKGTLENLEKSRKITNQPDKIPFN